LREYHRVDFSGFTALPGMPQRLRSPISEERNCREDIVDGGVCAAVPLRRVRVEIFAAIVACELRDETGGVCEPDDAAIYGAAGSARW